MSEIIRIEIEEKDGSWVYKYQVAFPGQPSRILEGSSRQPMLDACRELKSMGEALSAKCGLFRKGSSEPDLIGVVGPASELTVSDPARGGGPKLSKWQPRDPGSWGAGSDGE